MKGRLNCLHTLFCNFSGVPEWKIIVAAILSISGAGKNLNCNLPPANNEIATIKLAIAILRVV